MKNKIDVVKLLQAILGIGKLTNAAKVTAARNMENTAAGSDLYKGTPSLQALMKDWMAETDKLDQNQKDIKDTEDKLAVLRANEITLARSFDTTGRAYACGVDVVTKGDPVLVALLGLKTRSHGQPRPDPTVPDGLNVWYTKTGRPVLEWPAVPGAVAYIAQLSPAPAAEATFAAVIGKGRSRKLHGLVVEAHDYVCRVSAVGKTGVHTAWSAPLAFTAK